MGQRKNMKTVFTNAQKVTFYVQISYVLETSAVVKHILLMIGYQ